MNSTPTTGNPLVQVMGLVSGSALEGELALLWGSASDLVLDWVSAQEWVRLSEHAWALR